MLNSTEFSEHNLLSETELKNIVSSENLACYKGFGLSPNVRLFIFKQQPGAFSIKLISQALRDNCIAIIPPGQLHFLSPIECSDYICIEVPKNLLIDEDFGFMTRLIYSNQKHLHLGKMDGLDYEQFKLLLSNENNHQLSLQLLKNKIEKSYPNRLGKLQTPCDSYCELATNFEIAIKNIEHFTLKDTIIGTYIEKLNCSEKTLERACDEVFFTNPTNILKHHLMMSCISLLLTAKYSTESIAQLLGYSNGSSFLRFVKSKTNNTPSKIRRQIQEFNNW